MKDALHRPAVRFDLDHRFAVNFAGPESPKHEVRLVCGLIPVKRLLPAALSIGYQNLSDKDFALVG